jgi:hypothetical protein
MHKFPPFASRQKSSLGGALPWSKINKDRIVGTEPIS